MTSWKSLTSTVYSSSEYMSDELSKSMVRYASLMESRKGYFGRYLEEKETLETDKRALSNVYNDLNTKLITVKDRIDIYKGTDNFKRYELKLDPDNNALNIDYDTKDNSEYIVLVYSETQLGYDFQVDGTKFYPPLSEWHLIKKIATTTDSKINIRLSGENFTNTVVFEVILIDKEEFDTENNTSTLLERYSIGYNEAKLNKKKEEVENKESEIDSVDAKIEKLKNRISIESNFTSELIKERNQFIIERTWTDDFHFEEQALFDDAIEKLNELKIPKISFNISVVNFLAILDEPHSWDNPAPGDKILIHYERFGINDEAVLLEIHYDFESQDISLTIANAKDILSEDDKLAKMIKDTHTTSASIDMTKHKWNEDSKTVNELNDLLNAGWDAGQRGIVAGVNGSLQVTGRGIVSSSSVYPDELLVIQSGVIASSDTSGRVWNTLATPKGLLAKALIGNGIVGENLSILSDTDKFKFTKDGATFDSTSIIVEDAQGNNLVDIWNNALEKDKNYNGTTISEGNGLITQRDDNKMRTVLNATNGLSVEVTADSENWSKLLYVDRKSQTLKAKEFVITNDTGIDILIDSKTRLIDFDKFHFTVGTLDGVRITTEGDNGTITLENDLIKSTNKLGLSRSESYLSNGKLIIDKYEVDPLDDELSVINRKMSFGIDDIKFTNGSSVPLNLGYNSVLNKGYINAIVELDITSPLLKLTGTLDTSVEIKSPIIVTKEIKSRDNANSIITVGNGFVSYGYNGEQYWHSDKTADGWTRFKIGDVFLKSNQTNVLEVRNNADGGMATIKALEFETVSDREMKKNIEDLKVDGIEIIKGLKAKGYNFKDDKINTKKSIGFIAQEAPELISNGTSVNLYAISTVTIKALQEVIQRLEFLESRFK